MRNYIKYLLFAIVITAMCSCREIYYPDELESDEMVPVIQGIVEEGNAPVVKLYWATGYNNNKDSAISGAVVTVTEKNQYSVIYSEDLTETGKGNYTSVSGFRGKSGFTYNLYVTLPNGQEFYSSPQYLQTAPNIDSLYAIPEIRSVYSYNSYNELIYKEVEGLSFMADLSGVAAYEYKPVYCKFKTMVLKEMVYRADRGSPGEHCVYQWVTYRLDDPFTVNYMDGWRRSYYNDHWESTAILVNHPVGFVENYYDKSLETDSRTAPETVAWVVTFIASAVSEDVFEYYKSVEQQLSSSNQVIAPIPSQVKSNMTCQNHVNAKFVGVFEASAPATIYKAFGWKDMNTINEKDLDYFPDNMKGGEQPYFPPDFWVSFN